MILVISTVTLGLIAGGTMLWFPEVAGSEPGFLIIYGAILIGLGAIARRRRVGEAPASLDARANREPSFAPTAR